MASNHADQGASDTSLTADALLWSPAEGTGRLPESHTAHAGATTKDKVHRDRALLVAGQLMTARVGRGVDGVLSDTQLPTEAAQPADPARAGRAVLGRPSSWRLRQQLGP